MNRGRSRAAGVVLAPRFQMFPWTRVQVRGGDGRGDSRGSDGPREDMARAGMTFFPGTAKEKQQCFKHEFSYDL